MSSPKSVQLALNKQDIKLPQSVKSKRISLCRKCHAFHTTRKCVINDSDNEIIKQINEAEAAVYGSYIAGAERSRRALFPCSESLRSFMLEQRVFIEEHLSSWLSQYAAALIKAPRVDFYDAVVKAFAAFSSLDQVFTVETVVWVDELDQGEEDLSKCLASGKFIETEKELQYLESLDLYGLEDSQLIALG